MGPPAKRPAKDSTWSGGPAKKRRQSGGGAAPAWQLGVAAAFKLAAERPQRDAAMALERAAPAAMTPVWPTFLLVSATRDPAALVPFALATLAARPFELPDAAVFERLVEVLLGADPCADTGAAVRRRSGVDTCPVRGAAAALRQAHAMFPPTVQATREADGLPIVESNLAAWAPVDADRRAATLDFDEDEDDCGLGAAAVSVSQRRSTRRTSANAVEASNYPTLLHQLAALAAAVPPGGEQRFERRGTLLLFTHAARVLCDDAGTRLAVAHAHLGTDAPRKHATQVIRNSMLWRLTFSSDSSVQRQDLVEHLVTLAGGVSAAAPAAGDAAGEWSPQEVGASASALLAAILEVLSEGAKLLDPVQMHEEYDTQVYKRWDDKLPSVEARDAFLAAMPAGLRLRIARAGLTIRIGRGSRDKPDGENVRKKLIDRSSSGLELAGDLLEHIALDRDLAVKSLSKMEGGGDYKHCADSLGLLLGYAGFAIAELGEAGPPPSTSSPPPPSQATSPAGMASRWHDALEAYRGAAQGVTLARQVDDVLATADALVASRRQSTTP